MVERNRFIAKTFDENSFFSTVLRFTSGWDYKHFNKYISKKTVNLSSTVKKHLKCDVIVGSVVNGLGQPIPFNFVLDKPSGYKIFCGPKTIHYKKIIESVLKIITFHLEDDNNEKVKFNGGTLTFTLQMIKTLTNMFTYKYVYIN